MVDRIADIVVSGASRLGRSDDRVPVVSLLGEHDLATRDELRCVLEPLADEGRAFIIDVSPATFIDCSILHLLVSIDRRSSRHGPRPIIQIDAATVVGRIFQLTGCDEQLVCASSRNGAIELVGGNKLAQAAPSLEHDRISHLRGVDPPSLHLTSHDSAAGASPAAGGE